jgi:serine/threonine protein kinase/tetratricopeptide (TPR) repeat protein
MAPDDDKTRSHMLLASGTMVAHYRIVEKIGAGGMGEVYLAEDTELSRKVALKFLPLHLCQEEEYRKRFTREAQAAAKLNHPNIVTIHEVGEFLGRPYIVSEFVSGRTLSDAIGTKTLAPSEVINIIIQVCEGLEEAHAAGIVHRDIKPANIIIEKSGRLKIVDFGLAMIEGSQRVTRSGSAMGTIGYMSPEQLRGALVDRRTDLFSVGIVLYESITGINPFAADNQAAIHTMILSKQPEPVARYKVGVPDGLQDVVDRALEKEPQVRYQSAADMAADLKRLRRRSSDSERQIPPPVSGTRNPLVRSRYLVPAIVILLAGALWWNRHPGWHSTKAGQNHLAVIPFANLAGQSTSQAFCDGLMETLTSKLTQLAGSEHSLMVVPASEIRDSDVKSATQARKRFGVNLVVTGSVQQLDGHIRATLNLVDATTDRQLRSTVLDQRGEDISSLQDSSVAEVARLLDIPLLPKTEHDILAGGTRSSSAYRAYLEGRGYLQRHDDARTLDSARYCFDAAIRDDSAFALAYAGMGEMFWRRFNLTNDASWVEPAIRYSSRAVELDDRQAPVLVTLGILHRATGQYQEAISYFKRALLIDSLNSETYAQLATAYESAQRFGEAEATYRRSITLRPNYWRSYYNLARYFIYRGQNDSAVMQATTAESLAPAATLPYESIGSLYAFMGRFDRAKTLLERSLAIEPNYVALSNLGAIYQMEGELPKAVTLYESSLKVNDKDYRVWSSLAGLYKMLPDGRLKSQQAYERAITLAEQIRAVNPNEPDLICYLADCYWQVGQREKAVAMARDAVQMAPNNIEVMVRAGIIYELAGQRERSLQLIGTAIRRGYAIDRIKATEELRGLVADPRFVSATRTTN